MANITGTDAGEPIEGTAGDDVIDARGGLDMITVTRGHDVIDGGAGDDWLHVNAALLGFGAGSRSYTITADHLSDASGAIDTSFTSIESISLTDLDGGDLVVDASALTGAKLLLSLKGATVDVTGGAGDDQMTVHGAAGTIDGGGGSDTLTVNFNNAANTNWITVTETAGTTLLAQAGRDDISVRNVETIDIAAPSGALRVDASATSGVVHFTATAATDTILGGAGGSFFYALSGAAGSADVFTGGGGADTFQFWNFAALNGTTITDLSEDDAINLLGISAQLRFIGTAAFSGVAGEIRYVRGATETLLIGDADGDGVGDSILTLSGSFQIAEDVSRTWELRRAADEVTGTPGHDLVWGSSADQVITTLGGNDEIHASRGHDVIDAGAGTGDSLWIHSSPLRLSTAPHIYTITADRAFDSTGALDTSFSGIERIWFADSSTSDVTLDASAVGSTPVSIEVWTGTHTVTASANDDSVTVLGGTGTFDGGAGTDRLSIRIDSAANPGPLTLTEASGVVTLRQAGRNDLTARNFETLEIYSQGGAMRLDASATTRAFIVTSTALADTIVGGAGNNHFYSSPSATGAGDVFTGGGGADWYDFYSFAALDGATITDFSTADQIDLHLITASRFIGTAAFSGVAGEIRYTKTGGQTQLIGDANGDGVGDSVLTLSNRAMDLRETYAGSHYLVALPNQVTGTDAGESLSGTTGDDLILAMGGNDTVYASRGHDVVDGGSGSDRLRIWSSVGLPAGDHVYTITADRAFDASGTLDTSFSGIEAIEITGSSASTGDVTIDASTLGAINLSVGLGVGTHDVTTGAGNDLVEMLGGSGVFDGGAGNDDLSVQVNTVVDSNPLRVTQAGNVMTLTRSGAGDLIARNFESMHIGTGGGALNVDASGVSATFRFMTSNLADTIIGGTGENQFYAWSGGAGDVLTGGSGTDLYTFRSFAAFAGATITNLSRGDNLNFSEIANVHFIGTAAFSGTAGEIRYVASGSQTLVIGDGDGDGVGESVLTLTGRGLTLQEHYPAGYLSVFVNEITGTETGETLFGSTLDDLVKALGGNDTIKVSRGFDTVDGGAGSDVLELDAASLALGAGPHSYTVANGRLTGGSGAIDTAFTAIERLRVNDVTGSNVTFDASGLTGVPLIVTVLGGTHNLTGAASNDGFSIGGGSGVVDGGGGVDSLFFTTDNVVNANPVVVSQSGDATIFAQAGGPNLVVRNVENMELGARSGGALRADASASTLGVTFALTQYADTARGGTGNDTFYVAGPANGLGDVLTGGGGADAFAFGSFAAFSGATITDLGADDVIRIPASPMMLTFIGAREFNGVAGETRYLSGGGLTALLADIDGDGLADSALLITNGAFVLAETGIGSGELRIVGQMPVNDEDDNVMTGTEGADYLDSGAGDDTIDGRGGDDIINAGEGNDHVQGGGGNDTIHGDDGDDVIDGGAGGDSIFGDDGDDTLIASGGVAPSPGGGPGDWMMGGFGNDVLLASNGVFNMFGDDGGSTDGDGDDRLTLTGGQSGSWLSGGGGNDVIKASGTGMAVIDGGNGDDDITVSGFSGNILLGTGDDTLRIVNGGGFTLDMNETFGTGRDRVIVQSLSGFTTIMGMDAGEAGDVLDFSAYGANPFGTGALTITQSGANTIIGIPATGATIVIQNMVAANLSAFNLGVPSPLFAPVGLTINDAFHDSPALDWPSQLVGADGNDSIRGFGGNDVLYGAGGNDLIEGGQGDDWIEGGTGNDLLDGGVGIDTASYADTAASLTADLAPTAGVTVNLSITTAQNTGGAGVDTLLNIENLAGSGFDDVLTGNDGANTLGGDDGQDWLLGGGGADVVTGGEGHDSVWGGDGDDLLRGGAGDDTLFGGAGIDTASYSEALAGVEIDLSWLEEQQTRGAGVDTLIAVENVIGSRFDDVLAGNAGANVLTGGGGNDRFVFAATGARDTITDFAAGDWIDLSAIDANGALAGDAAFDFIGGAGFGGVAGQLRVSGSGSSWLVEADLNGDRVADFSIAVTTLTPGLGLAASDFLL